VTFGTVPGLYCASIEKPFDEDFVMVIPFTWNGRRVLARSGDTIAAALWRHRVLALGVSRKRHRPLGISGAFLQGALVQVDGLPHVRADETRVTPHMRVTRQGVWPSARFDVLRLLELIPASWTRGGFEHPRWLPGGTRRFELWERLMMFLAGEVALGARAPGAPPHAQGNRWDGDIVVVGGGPAGRTAANGAAASGLRTCLVSPSDPPGTLARALGVPLPDLDPRVDVLARHRAVGVYRRGTVVLAAPLEGAQAASILVTKRLVIAIGRRSVPPLVPGLDLPGVLDAHAAIELAASVNSHLGPAVVVGTGLQEGFARALAERGVEIAGARHVGELRRIEGGGRVERAVIGAESIACRAVVHAGPWIVDPSLSFQAAADGDLRLVSGKAPSHVSVVGAAADGDEPLHMAPTGEIADAPVCPCMDATVGEILSHVRAGEGHVEVLKRATSCGMGPCQGFPCWEMMRAVIKRAVPALALDDRPSHRPPRRALTVEQAAALDGLLEIE
jgi:sarcosine oxidase subunit alpha